MAKIPFDIKFRPQIESGEYRVETKAGCPVRIVCWDMACELPILGLVLLNDEEIQEMAIGFTNEGTNLLGEPLYDKLFIITPEEELSEFEERVKQLMGCYPTATRENRGSLNYEVRKAAAELLDLARKEFIKQGYVIEKKAFHDAVEKIEPEMMKQVSEAVDLSNFEYAMLRYVQEGTNAKNDKELIELTKNYSKELHKYV